MLPIKRLRDWLVADALPVWLEKGYDRQNQSFHERLNFDFTPITCDGKRVLVQARQVYTYSFFANSIDGASDAAQSAFEFMYTKCRHPTGGWRHRVTREGAPLDDSRDLYDQAFAIFAGAMAFRATGQEEALAVAVDTLEYLEAERAHPAGGYTELVSADGNVDEGLRRQNPHMHLFEAVLALFEVTGDDSFLQRAERLYDLTRSKLIVDNTLREYFTDTLEPAPGYLGEIVEPGHQMEWVWLLHRYAKVTETPAATVLAGTLYDFVLAYGYDTRTGGLYDELTTRGEVHCSHRRLWPQTEALKAHVARLEHTSDDLAQARITDGIGNLFKYHLIGVPGSWREHICQGGENFYGCYPASSLYHLAFAVGELERVGNAD